MEEQFGGFLGVPGTLLEGSGGGLGEVLGRVLVVLEGILDALPPKKAPRIPRGAPKSSPRHHQEAPRGSRRPPKGSVETVFEAPKAMKITLKETLKLRCRNPHF